ncbi:MAG: WYL domain-containing protein [Acidimicrobiia bacterium]|nr:WYL domain-containing protein [Acidimicrobiia bacterium]
MSSAKLERLLNLTAALLETERALPATTIRERVPGYPADLATFRRAFERDKDDLREMGIPLRIERVSTDASGEIDGYRIPPDEYYLPDPGLTPDEVAALQLATRVVRAEGSTEALWKLGGGLDAPAAPADPDAPAEATVALPVDERLSRLFGALAERRVVTFAYGGRARTVEPHRLDFNRGRWYLIGHDRDRDDSRTFRLDRIANPLDVLDERFTARAHRHPGARLQPWELGGEADVVARLLVDADQAGWAIQHLGAEAVEERRADGSAIFRIPVANRQAFRSFALTFLEHAEVLSPPELRDDVVGWLRRLASGRDGTP